MHVVAAYANVLDISGTCSVFGRAPRVDILCTLITAAARSGLQAEHRELVEDGFRGGALSVLVATSTVATGVNLPAQRVIIRDTFIGKATNTLDATRFRQMCGRAGRAGIDTKGEAVVMLTSKTPAARRTIEHLITAEVRPCAAVMHSGADRGSLSVCLVLTAARRCCSRGRCRAASAQRSAAWTGSCSRWWSPAASPRPRTS